MMMQYQVTCNHCHKRFRIEAGDEETIRCTCPYCAQSLLIRLARRPSVSSPQKVRQAGQPVVAPMKKRTDSKAKMMVAILTAVLSGGGIAAGLIYWQHKQAAQTALIQQQRKAHRDSVARLRQAIQDKAMADEQARQRQAATCRFLESFYRKSVLTDGDPSFYERYLTDYCRTMILGISAGEESGEEDRWAAWWGAFGTLSAAPDFHALAAHLRVSFYKDDWYKVRLSQDGVTEFRLIRVVYDGGQVLIDEVR